MEFDFDLGADTAMSVATEMVNELSLSHEDARASATAIGDEIKQLTGKCEHTPSGCLRPHPGCVLPCVSCA